MAPGELEPIAGTQGRPRVDQLEMHPIGSWLRPGCDPRSTGGEVRGQVQRDGPERQQESRRTRAQDRARFRCGGLGMVVNWRVQAPGVTTAQDLGSLASAGEEVAGRPGPALRVFPDKAGRFAGSPPPRHGHGRGNGRFVSSRLPLSLAGLDVSLSSADCLPFHFPLTRRPRCAS